MDIHDDKWLIKYRTLLIVFFETMVVIAAFYLAFLIRYDFSLPEACVVNCPTILVPVILIKMLVFWRTGMLRGWWRYASLADVIDIFKSTLIASVAVTLYLVFVHRLTGVPRSVLLLDGLFTFVALAGARFFSRIVRERYVPYFHLIGGKLGPTVTTLVVGSEEAGQSIVREIRKSPQLNNDVIGYVDDNPRKAGMKFQGLPVLGATSQIGKISKKHAVKLVIIASPSATAQQIKKIVEQCQRAGVAFKILPPISDLIDGKVSIQQIRDVDVQDLLRRKPIELDTTRIRQFLQGKRILVTGAAGSIGSEICRQVLHFAPERVLLLDMAESPLFHVEQELLDRYSQSQINSCICDIRDRARTERIIEEFRPQVIFHAAAYKHVPLMEKNPAEAVGVNVRGTRIVADAAVSCGVESFVMISTDKAVHPTSIMGATKRAAEVYIQTLAQNAATHFITVRFGNVLGSSGSVVPIFKEQIRKGGPVTVTHPEVTRFFMTIPEATQLVLQAGSMGKGGEIFLLDMGEPVKIVELAEELIRLSGLEPYDEIGIEFTGLRPGEKLYEELLLSGEDVQPTEHTSIHIARAERHNAQTVLALMEELYLLQRQLDRKGLVQALQRMVPEFTPESMPWSATSDAKEGRL